MNSLHNANKLELFTVTQYKCNLTDRIENKYDHYLIEQL
jgi:hypothetical protein